jgi:hypothetical protein
MMLSAVGAARAGLSIQKYVTALPGAREARSHRRLQRRSHLRATPLTRLARGRRPMAGGLGPAPAKAELFEEVEVGLDVFRHDERRTADGEFGGMRFLSRRPGSSLRGCPIELAREQNGPERRQRHQRSICCRNVTSARPTRLRAASAEVFIARPTPAKSIRDRSEARWLRDRRRQVGDRLLEQREQLEVGFVVTVLTCADRTGFDSWRTCRARLRLARMHAKCIA